MRCNFRGGAAFVAAAALLCACARSAPHVAALAGIWPQYQSNAAHNAVVARGALRVRWKFDARARINGGLAVVGGRVFLDTFSGDLVSLHLATGKIAWKHRADNIVMSTPVVGDGLVVFGTGRNGASGGTNKSFVYAGGAQTGKTIDFWGRPAGDHLLAFEAATGARRWAYRTAGEDMPSPAIADGRVLFANGDAHAYALSLKKGHALWQRSLGGIATMASANFAAGRVFVSVCSHAMRRAQSLALAPSTGRILWRAPFGNCDSAPTYAHGRLFLSGVSGNTASFGFGSRAVIAALDARTGRMLWRYRSKHARPYSKVGSSERAIAGTYANGLYYQAIPTSDELLAFDPATGAVRWRFRSNGAIKMSPVVAGGKLFVGDAAGLFYSIDAKSGRLLAVKMFADPFATAPPVLVGKTLLLVNGESVYAFPLVHGVLR